MAGSQQMSSTRDKKMHSLYKIMICTRCQNKSEREHLDLHSLMSHQTCHNNSETETRILFFNISREKSRQSKCMSVEAQFFMRTERCGVTVSINTYIPNFLHICLMQVNQLIEVLEYCLTKQEWIYLSPSRALAFPYAASCASAVNLSHIKHQMVRFTINYRLQQV